MKLEKYTCLGGRVDGKEIVGIKLNKQTIYPPFESDELYNSYTLGYIAHPTEGNSSTWYTVSVVKKDCFMDYELRTDWGDGTIDNATTHQYSFMKEYTIITNGFLSVKSTDGTAYPAKVNHIRHDIIDGSSLFYDFKNVNVSYADGDNLYLPETFYMTNMSNMFYNCDGLKGYLYDSDGAVDLSGFNTRKVVSMWRMFYDCNNLITLDISNFDMTNVTDTDSMFYNCTNLRELRLDNCNNETIFKIISSSHFPTNIIGTVRKIYIKKENATGLTTPENWIFIDCETGEEIIPESIKLYEPYEFKNTDMTEITTLVTKENRNLSYMFFGCDNLTTINFMYMWDTNYVSDMSYMFTNCHNLTKLNLKNFSTGQVYNMRSMFSSCIELTELDLSNFNTSQVYNMDEMFFNCKKLEKLNLSYFDMSNVDSTYWMFNGSNNLKEIRLDNCNFVTLKAIMNELPTRVAIGEARGKIYCKEANLTYNDETLTATDGWNFVFVD